MTHPLIIHIPLAAIGKGRSRSSPTSHYTPQKTREYEKAVAQYAGMAMGNRLVRFHGPVRLTIRCEYQPPKSWSKKRRDAVTGRGKTTKPDLDNVVKALCDAMNGVVFNDDSQVVELIVVKVYAAHDRIEIKVELSI